MPEGRSKERSGKPSGPGAEETSWSGWPLLTNEKVSLFRWLPCVVPEFLIIELSCRMIPPVVSAPARHRVRLKRFRGQMFVGVLPPLTCQ